MANNDSSITAFFGGDTSGLEKAVDRSIGVVGMLQNAVAGIGVTVAMGALIGFFKSVSDKASELKNLSDSVGVGTDAIQSFSHAVRLAGGDVKDVGLVLRTVRNNVDLLAEGNEKATATFAKLGISQKELVGIPLEQALERIAKGFVANKDTAGAYAALVDIVGSKSAKLTGVFTELGEKGLAAFDARARNTGQMMTEEVIAKLDETSNRLTIVKEGAKNGGAALLAFALAAGEKLGGALGPLGAMIKLFGLIPATASEAAAAQVKATERATEAIRGQAGTVKDFAAFNEAEAKREMERLQMKGDGQAYMNALLQRATAYIKEGATYAENSKEQLELVSKANALILEYDKEIAKQEKKIADERKNAADEHIKAMDKLGELQFERLSSEEKVVKLFSEASTIVVNTEKMKREGKDTTMAQIALLETQNKLAEVGKTLSTEQLEAALKKAGATQQEIDAIKTLIALVVGGLKPATVAMTESVIDQAAAWDRITGRVKTVQGEVIKLNGIIAGIRGGSQLGGEKTEVLQEIIRRNKAEADRLSAIDAISPASQRYNMGEIARLTLENQNLQRVLSLRTEIVDTVDKRGYGAGLAQFPGKPELFDQFLSVAKGQDQRFSELNTSVQSIEQTLRNVFKK